KAMGMGSPTSLPGTPGSEHYISEHRFEPRVYDLAMSVSHTSRAGDPAPSRTVESRYLYQIINTVSSSLDLDRVLRAIVDLVSEAIDCHACWIYFVDPDDDGLVLRAVSDPYSALAGRLRFEPGEGLAGWVA